MDKRSILIAAGITAFILIFFFGCKITVKNNEVRLRNSVMAEKTIYESNFDKMYKVIAQVAQIPAAAEKTFNNIYPDLIKGRYSNARGGSLMSWITENNPQFDFSLYKDLERAIEANRQEFYEEGRRLKDMQREHRNIIMTWPGTMFLDAKDTISVTIITSDKTEGVFKTGKDNDIELFKK